MLHKLLEIKEQHDHKIAACDLYQDATVLRQVSYQELFTAVFGLVAILKKIKEKDNTIRRIGILAKNSILWLVMDLAVLFSDFIEIPIPLLFSKAQAKNLIDYCDLILVDRFGETKIKAWALSHIPYQQLALEPLLNQTSMPFFYDTKTDDSICKVIHTSGTTNTPKGVKISRRVLSKQALQLKKHNHYVDYSYYLSMLPASLLLEQMAGYYQCLLSGGCIYFTSPDEPLVGQVLANENYYIDLLAKIKMTACILTPSLLHALTCKARQAKRNKVGSIYRFLFASDVCPYFAVGGADTPISELQQLQTLGIPVYQGYGLSEHCSVATLNTPDANRLGSIGKALPGVALKILADQTLLIKSETLFSGYTTVDASSGYIDDDGWLHTGDLARIDTAGYVYFLGRKKNILITANGRNINPVWLAQQFQTLSFINTIKIFITKTGRCEANVSIRENIEEQEALAALYAFSRENFSDVEQIQTFHIESKVLSC